MQAMQRRSQVLALFLLVVIVSGLSAQENVDPKKGRVTANPTSVNSFTIEQEVQLGRQALPQVEKKLKLLPANRPMSKYIAQLGQQLADKAPGYKFPYRSKSSKRSPSMPSPCPVARSTSTPD
jgi:predicted Zn-dependent protease